MKFIFKTFFWIIIAVLIIIFTAGLFTQTPIFRSLVKEFALSAVNNNISGLFTVEEIGGNFYQEIEVRNAVFLFGNDSIIILPKLTLRYEIASLLDKQIDVRYLEIETPRFNLAQDSSGVWNVERLFSSDREVDTLVIKDNEPFPFTLLLKKLVLLDGNIRVSSNELIIPEMISNLYLGANGSYEPGAVSLALDSLSFLTVNPDFRLINLGFNFMENEDGMHLKNLKFRSASNVITSEASLLHAGPGQVNLTAQKLNLTEFEFILPDMRFKTNPDIILKSGYDRDSLSFEIGVMAAGEAVVLEGNVENYGAFFDSTGNSRLHFLLNLFIENLHMQNWIAGFPNTTLSGNLNIKGEYSGRNDLNAEIEGKLEQLQIEEYQLENFLVQAKYLKDKIQGHIQFNSGYGDARADLTISDIKNKSAYHGYLSVSHVNIGKILKSESLDSDLNLILRAEGLNFGGADYFAAIDMAWRRSVFKGMLIDTLSSSLHLSGSRYDLEHLEMISPAGIFTLSGWGDLRAVHYLEYAFKPDNLQHLAGFLSTDSVSAQGVIKGVVQGNPDSLLSNSLVDLRNIRYQNIYLDKLALDLGLNRSDSELTLTAELDGRKLRIDEKVLDHIRLKTEYEEETFSSFIDVTVDSMLSFNLSSFLRVDSIIQLSCPRIDVRIRDEQWSGELEKFTYNTDTKDVYVDDFYLDCINCADQRKIKAGGLLSLSGMQKFNVSLEGIRPETIFSYLDMESEFDGRTSLNLSLSGDAADLELEGTIKLGDGHIGTLPYNEMLSTFSYNADRLDYNFILNFNEKDSLKAEGYLPLHLSLTDTLPLFDAHKPLALAIKSTEIPVGLLLNNIKVIPDIEGTLSCDFSLSNSLADPVVRGDFRLKNGILRSPYWGIDYKDINLHIKAVGHKFTVEKLQAKSSEGYLNGSGSIELAYGPEKNKIVYSDLRISADRFFLLQHKDFEIQLTSDIKYLMENGQPRISGHININRSSFYLPTILARAGYVTSGDNSIRPLLVQARNRRLGIAETDQEIKLVRSESDSLRTPGFLDLLEGDVELRIPRQSWIRNPQLRLELGGNIGIKMSGGDFTLKGPVDIVRGQYDLFGRRFTVVEGKVDFLGTKNINPPISLEAEYVYRTVGREKRYLVFKISGSLENPVISFFDMNDRISQDDAISIILYGRKRDELSFGAQSDLNDTPGVNTAAMGLVSNLVSDRLTRSIGDDLKLDVIEVNATDNWQSANFVVGKYITEDIFVTYKREFGQSLDNNLYPETISMEYEIQRFIFLQLIQGAPQISGIDLLFRFDWE